MFPEYLGIIQTNSPQYYDLRACGSSARPVRWSFFIRGFLPSYVEASRPLKDHANLSSQGGLPGRNAGGDRTRRDFKARQARSAARSGERDWRLCQLDG